MNVHEENAIMIFGSKDENDNFQYKPTECDKWINIQNKNRILINWPNKLNLLITVEDSTDDWAFPTY